MKWLIFILLIFTTYCPPLLAQQILKLEGEFQGVNLYMQNPTVNDTCFCTDSIIINGKNTNQDLFASAIEIKIKDFYINLGDRVVIEIHHKKNCKPKILNSNVCPKYPYIFHNIELNKEGDLKWEAISNDKNALYSIQQYRWNRWITIGTINTKGISKNYNYSHNVKFHSGENKFRIKQNNTSRKFYTSKTIIRNSDLPENHIFCDKNNSKITLDYESDYEIYDSKGNKILTGPTKQIDISILKKGVYYINYDNKTESIVRK